MSRRVMTTGGYSARMEEKEDIESEVKEGVGKAKFTPDQITGISDDVRSVMGASDFADMREKMGINEDGSAVNGKDGSSAYQLAVSAGYSGTLNEWLASLHGKDGSDGINGKDGADGKNGSDGKDGTDGLPGKDGINGSDGKNGTDGQKGADGTDGLAGKDGAAGKDGVNGTNGKDGVNATTTATATTTANGLMSSTDKTKLDGINTRSSSSVASGVRPVGIAFTISATRDSRASYTFSYSLSATLTVGQTIQIVATVDGNEVGRIVDGIILGLAGSVAKTKSLSFDVPAGKPVLFTKTGTSAITATVVSGQETLL